MNLCKDCKHCKKTVFGPSLYRCFRPTSTGLINPVVGGPLIDGPRFCDLERDKIYLADKCGPEGKYWVKKESRWRWGEFPEIVVLTLVLIGVIWFFSGWKIAVWWAATILGTYMAAWLWVEKR